MPLPELKEDEGVVRIEAQTQEVKPLTEVRILV